MLEKIGVGTVSVASKRIDSTFEFADTVIMIAPRVMTNNSNINVGQDSSDSHSPNTSAFLAAAQQSSSSMDDSSGDVIDANLAGAVMAPEESTDSILTSS